MVCQCGGIGKGIKSKVGGELDISLQALFTYLCDLFAFWLHNLSSDPIVFQQVMGPHMWVAWLEVWLLVCIERDLEVLEPIWSFEVHKCLIGALWRYLEAFGSMCAHSNIVSLDLSHWGVFVHIWFIEHLIWVGWVHFECLRRHWCKWEPLRAEFCD